MHKLKPISHLLNTALGDLVEQVHQISNINELLKEFIDPSMIDHCQVVRFDQGSLVIAVDDPVWSTTLRYELPKLRDWLREKKKLYELRNIKIIVSSGNKHHKKSKTNLQLTKNAKLTINMGIAGIEYEPLRKAFENLIME